MFNEEDEKLISEIPNVEQFKNIEAISCSKLKQRIINDIRDKLRKAALDGKRYILLYDTKNDLELRIIKEVLKKRGYIPKIIGNSVYWGIDLTYKHFEECIENVNNDVKDGDDHRYSLVIKSEYAINIYKKMLIKGLNKDYVVTIYKKKCV